MKKEEVDWPKKLQPSHPNREGALAELRDIIARSLTSALSGRAGQDRAFIEDICQISMIRILEKLDTFQGRSRFTSWALSISMRIAFNELRRKQWNDVSIDHLLEDNESGIAKQETEFTPIEIVERNNFMEFIHNTIKSRLTEKQQTVLLAELSGMPQEEIARQMKTTRNNVYKLFHDARKALKRELEQSGFGIQEMRELFSERVRRTTR